MNRFQILIGSEVVEALGYTLLHALWQGALVAALLWVLLGLWQPGSARVRYWLSYGALLTMAAFSLLTFLGYLFPHAAALPAAESSGQLLSPNVYNQWAWTQTFPLLFQSLDQVASWLSPRLPWLVGAWAVGVALMSIRLYGGWRQVHRLRRHEVRPVPKVWEERLAHLQKRLGIQKQVQLWQTPHLRVPVVMGWVRPVILLPLGCLTNLPTAQLEGILLHELAHVRRHDYLHNLLQTLLETIYFYHPAAWWISARIRTERENCCDDLAVAHSGDALTYANALLTLTENTMKTPAFAMSLHQGSLLGRIKRLLQPAPRPGFAHARPVSLLVLLSFTLGSAGAIARWQAPQPVTALVPAAAPFQETPARNLNEAQPEVLLPAQQSQPALSAEEDNRSHPSLQPLTERRAQPAPVVVQDTTKTLRLRRQAKEEVPPAPPVPPAAPEAPAPPPPPPFDPADPPLLYIDGKEVSYSKFQELKPEEIESIEVLKDESAVKTYGEKARKGVIRIKTKK